MIAEAVSPDWIAPLLQFGIGGGVLVWFMFRSEPRLKAIEQAIDRMSRSVLLLIVTFGSTVHKEQAKSIEEEINQAEKDRNK